MDTPEETPEPANDRIEQLEKQVADYKLLLADYENSRKRLAQDAERQRKYFAEPIARDMLSVIDNLERAVDAAKKAGETGALAQGVTATIGMFIDTLKRHGVKVVETTLGGPFDPNVHQAVSQVPSAEYKPGAVAQILQHGYMLHDRILRPATVVVVAEPG